MRVHLLVAVLLLVATPTALSADAPPTVTLAHAGGLGIGFCVGDGLLLVTSSDLGKNVWTDEVDAQFVAAYPDRGIALWELSEPRPCLNLSATRGLRREDELACLVPHILLIEDLMPCSSSARRDLRGEVWEACASVLPPPGAPVVQRSTGQVVGLVVRVVENRLVIATADSIRLVLYERGIRLPAAVRSQTQPEIQDGWPYRGVSQSALRLSDARRVERWREVTGLLPASQTSIVESDGLFYLGDCGGRVACVDAPSKQLVWSQQLPWAVLLDPIASGGALYVTTSELRLGVRDSSVIFRRRNWYAHGAGTLYALDRETGEVRWQKAGGLHSSFRIAHGRVLFGGLGGYGAINAETGDTIWSRGQPADEQERPFWYLTGEASDGEMPVLGIQLRVLEERPHRTLEADGALIYRRVALGTGTSRREVPLGDVPQSEHPFAAFAHFAADGETLVLAIGTHLLRFNLMSGRVLSEHILPGDVLPGAVVNGSDLIIPVDAPGIVCYSLPECSLRWYTDNMDGAPGSPLVTQGRVFFGDFHGDIHAVSQLDGEEQWRLDCPGGSIGGAPTLLSGILYVAASDGRLYAIRVPPDPGSDLGTQSPLEPGNAPDHQ